MESLATQLKAYNVLHTNKTNKILHYIGIPAVISALLISLSWVSLSIAVHWHISFAWLAVIALLVYYYFLDVKLALVMTLIIVLLTLLCTWIAFPTPTTGNLILFLVLLIGGMALLFIGHTVETLEIDFATYVRSLFIAPLYVVAELLLALNFGKPFNLEENQLSTSTSSSKPPISKTPPSL